MLRSIGDHQSITTYKAGAAKILAARSAAAAAKNDDNYAYFATARFMQKKWGSYPEYPKMWNIYKRLENMAVENLEPGVPTRATNVGESADSDAVEIELPGDTYSISSYPP